MALGEAHVLALTKRALTDAGVNVESLEEAAAASGRAAAATAVARSATTLLVKNLPYSASEAELQVCVWGSLCFPVAFRMSAVPRGILQVLGMCLHAMYITSLASMTFSAV